MIEEAFIFPEDPQPRWANPEHTMIRAMIIFPRVSEDPVPYTALQVNPGAPHSETIFDILASGDLGIPVAPYVAPPEIVPASISDRQFAHELRARSLITQAEALAFVARGELPAALSALIAALPTQQARDDAELLLAGATSFERGHPLTATLAAGFGWTSQQADEFFIAAAAR